MRNKGFTLIELVGTIVILSLILLIITPIVTTSIRNGVNDADEQVKANIVLAAKNWASDNKEKISSGYSVSIQELIEGGYLDDDVKLPSTNEDISGCVKITKDAGASKKVYNYEYSDECN